MSFVHLDRTGLCVNYATSEISLNFESLLHLLMTRLSTTLLQESPEELPLEACLTSRHVLKTAVRQESIVMSEPLMIVLQKAPALLDACQGVGALKQLRAVCSTARKIATAAVTIARFQLEDTAEQADMLPVLQSCKLRKLQLFTVKARPSGRSFYPLASAAIKGEPAHSRHPYSQL